MNPEIPSEKARRSRRLRTIAAFTVAGLCVGGLAGYGMGRMLKDCLPSALALGWSEIAMLLISLWLVLSGGLITIAGKNRRMAAQMIDPAEPREPTPAQRALFRLQAWVLMLAGVILAIPVVVQLLPGGDRLAWRVGAMAALLVLLVLHATWNFAIWRKADEFMRAVISGTATTCFWVLQVLLLIWAAGEKLDLLPTANLWDALVVVMAVYLVVGIAQSVRKGAA